MVLFLTLVAVGTSLLFDATAKFAFGVAVLGVSMAWMIGSNNRVVQCLLASLGVVILIGLLK